MAYHIKSMVRSVYKLAASPGQSIALQAFNTLKEALSGYMRLID